MDYDEIINAKKGDLDTLLIVEDDVIFGVDEGEVAVSGVIVTLLFEIFGHRNPGADIIPVEGGFNIEHSLCILHESVVDGDRG